MTEQATAGEVTERARRQVGGLLARGVRPGDWVAFLEPGSVDLLAAIHGCLLAGIAPVVLSPGLTAHERDELLTDLPVRVVGDLTPGPPADLGPFHRARPVHVTSGTTGSPKAVWSGWLDADAASALHAEEREVWGLSADDVHLVLAPLSHSAPLRFALNTVLAGGSVVVLPKFDAATAAAAIARYRPTTTFAAPAHLQRLLDVPDLDTNSFRLVAHAGSPCPERVKRAALATFPPGVVTEFYGSTEAQFTVCPPEEWLAHPGTVGRARPGRELRVRDGRVWVRLPAHARFTYFDAPAKTAAAWDDDWFTAGDLGDLDDDGRLFLRGRDGDLVITGGVNVYPAEVERALAELPGVEAVVVFGVPDERWGEQVRAVVEGSVTPEAVGAWAVERLAAPKRPKRVTVVAALPRTHSGKPDRRAAQRLG
ncbi:class I adenylate-forming enzyme family protein [Jatrophihabitans sp. YIM 134969]